MNFLTTFDSSIILPAIGVLIMGVILFKGMGTRTGGGGNSKSNNSSSKSSSNNNNTGE